MAYYLNGYTPPQGVTNKEQVKNVQRSLNAQGASLNVDGVWGPKTQAAYAAANGGAAGGGESALTDKIRSYASQILAALDVPQTTTAQRGGQEIENDISAWLRPSYDNAIADRKRATDTYRAQIDADAIARGMGTSTYVSDLKSRQLANEARDIANLETEYAAALGKLVYEALSKQEERAFEAEKLNSERLYDANMLALESAYTLYRDEIAALAAAAKKSGGSGRRSASAATAAKDIIPSTREQCEEFLALQSEEARGLIYYSGDEKSARIRDELIASVGPAGYMQLQEMYPGYHYGTW